VVELPLDPVERHAFSSPLISVRMPKRMRREATTHAGSDRRNGMLHWVRWLPLDAKASTPHSADAYVVRFSKGDCAALEALARAEDRSVAAVLRGATRVAISQRGRRYG
jgi:hypothetical protein